jgi:hypothetical protein
MDNSAQRRQLTLHLREHLRQFVCVGNIALGDYHLAALLAQLIELLLGLRSGYGATDQDQ